MLKVRHPLRIGLVGAGPWAASVHAPGIARHPDVILAGVWTRDRRRSQALAERYGGIAFVDLESLVDAVDAVAFAVAPEAQATLALRAVAAGRHLICEKPLASDFAGAQRLADAVVAQKVTSIMMLTRRFDPLSRSWLESLKAAPPRWGHARWFTAALLGGQFSESAWRKERGALLDIGPHVVDLLDNALGEIEEVDWSLYREPDLWQLCFRHIGGAVSWAAFSLRVPLEANTFELTVGGSQGRYTIGNQFYDVNQCYSRLLGEFVSMVRQGRWHHPCDVRRGVHLQWVLDEARKKSRSFPTRQPGFELRRA